MSGLDSESASVGPESEEEETNPYPLDGKFTDEEDRERLVEPISHPYSSIDVTRHPII